MVTRETDVDGTFANNDIVHADPTGADHDTFSFGLKKSLLNYMHGIGYEEPIQKWFDFKVPKTTVKPEYILNELNSTEAVVARSTSKVIWLGKPPVTETFIQSKKGNQREMMTLTFTTKTGAHQIQVVKTYGDWLVNILSLLSVHNLKTYTLYQVQENYEAAGLEDFELLWDNKPVNTLNKAGLLIL
jgi:hypothetical protein